MVVSLTPRPAKMFTSFPSQFMVSSPFFHFLSWQYIYFYLPPQTIPTSYHMAILLGCYLKICIDTVVTLLRFFIQLELFSVPTLVCHAWSLILWRVSSELYLPNRARPILCGGARYTFLCKWATPHDPTVDRSPGPPRCKFRAPSVYFLLFGAYQLLCCIKNTCLCCCLPVQ